MATTALGLTVPAGSDTFDPQGDMVIVANSMRSRIIVPVANTTARTSLVSAIDWTPSAAEPLRVCRADAAAGAELEVTRDGTTWRTIYSDTTTWTTITLDSGIVAAAGYPAPAYRLENGGTQLRLRATALTYSTPLSSLGASATGPIATGANVLAAAARPTSGTRYAPITVASASPAQAAGEMFLQTTGAWSYKPFIALTGVSVLTFPDTVWQL